MRLPTIIKLLGRLKPIQHFFQSSIHYDFIPKRPVEFPTFKCFNSLSPLYTQKYPCEILPLARLLPVFISATSHQSNTLTRSTSLLLMSLALPYCIRNHQRTEYSNISKKIEVRLQRPSLFEPEI